MRHFISRLHPARVFPSAALATRLAIALMMVIPAIPLAAIAQQYIPPNRGLPGRRESGGTRGCWQTTAVAPEQHPLTALVPAQNFGTTTHDRPVVFIYIPSHLAEQAVAAEFSLADADDNELYKFTYQVTHASGVIQLNLPDAANLPPLEVGQDYRWTFALLCDRVDPSANMVVESWVQRIAPSPELSAALEQAPAGTEPSLYAESGIWYDAIASLAAQSTPSATAWRTLLESVGLETLAAEVGASPLTLTPPPPLEVGDNGELTP
ncbi:MAG: DUF928 domain-containing protein [Kaiparowitsia implicata GSE-PSE-MK54-09C]|nr:DUF928 domain-containing protein [Kaiparowitsia implicata GSE-PSE-MK54-09C]